MKLGSGRKEIYSSPVDVESRSDPASDAHASSPSMRELFQHSPVSDILEPSCDQNSEIYSPGGMSESRG
jgi:hypothetical protein